MHTRVFESHSRPAVSAHLHGADECMHESTGVDSNFELKYADSFTSNRNMRMHMPSYLAIANSHPCHGRLYVHQLRSKDEVTEMRAMTVPAYLLLDLLYVHFMMGPLYGAHAHVYRKNTGPACEYHVYMIDGRA